MGNKLPMMEVVKGDGNKLKILEVVKGDGNLEVVKAKLLQVMSDGGKQIHGWFVCDSVPNFLIF